MIRSSVLLSLLAVAACSAAPAASSEIDDSSAAATKPKKHAPAADAGAPTAPTAPTAPKTFTLDFAAADNGFAAGFADYPVGSETFYALQSGLRPLPAPLNATDATKKGFLLSGNNHSDDLLMFTQGAVDGVAAGDYDATLAVEFASQADGGGFGVGGSPGTSVWVKLGVLDAPATTVKDRQGYARMAIDVGSQSNGGKAAEQVGNVGVDEDAEGNVPWQMKTLATTTPAKVTAKDGKVWLWVGVDSGFEATTAIYVTKLTLTLTPR